MTFFIVLKLTKEIASFYIHPNARLDMFSIMLWTEMFNFPPSHTLLEQYALENVN